MTQVARALGAVAFPGAFPARQGKVGLGQVQLALPAVQPGMQQSGRAMVTGS